MLAEKFFLVLETLKSHASSDGSPRVVSTAPHVPIQLPRRTRARCVQLDLPRPAVAGSRRAKLALGGLG